MPETLTLQSQVRMMQRVIVDLLLDKYGSVGEIEKKGTPLEIAFLFSIMRAMTEQEEKRLWERSHYRPER